MIVRDIKVKMLLGAALGIVARLGLIQDTDASHPKGPDHDHIGSINSYEPEDFCVWVEDNPNTGDPVMDFGRAYSRIAGTLMVNEPSLDWNWLNVNHVSPELMDGPKLAFSATGPTPCDENPNRGKIELEYWVTDAGCGGWSCAFRYDEDRYRDPISGHDEFRYYYVNFMTSHIDQPTPAPGTPKPWLHVINHETGHMFGLDDPACVADPYNPGSTFECPAGWRRECGSDGAPAEYQEQYGLPDSVMHSLAAYGCAENREWPSINDWNSVLTLIGSQQTTRGGSWNKV